MSTLTGLGVSFGIALGRAMVIGRRERDVPRYRLPEGSERRELRRFLAARREARDEIRELRGRAAGRVGEKYAGIFDAHMMILDDRKLGRETLDLIRHKRLNVEWALSLAVGRVLRVFEQLDDPTLRERAGDIEDVHQRLQRLLAGGANHQTTQLELTEDTVIVASSLSPSDAIWLHQPRIVAFVTEEGGRTSHTAILANALEIPAVLGVARATRLIEEDDELVVDGLHGKVVTNPDAEAIDAYVEERAELERLGSAMEAERGPVTTMDGVSLTLSANIEFVEEMRTCERVGAEGVGLYRSEFLFLTTAPGIPGEEDHLRAYLRIAEMAGEHAVVIRTLDLGGEKYFHEVLEGGEANPVMGLRAVRLCLARPEIFRPQVRGLLRAAAERPNIWIMVPMVSRLAEWREVRAFVENEAAELAREGVDVPQVPLGCMIEVPSAALEAERLAAEADFFSIGTNDLIQYTLAVDRANGAVAYLYDSYDPAVLGLIERTLSAARTAGIPASLCGEMASDPLGALTLLGMGLVRYSCNPLLVPEIRTVLRRADAGAARRIVERAREETTGAGVRARLVEGFRPLIAEVLGPAGPQNGGRNGGVVRG